MLFVMIISISLYISTQSILERFVRVRNVILLDEIPSYQRYLLQYIVLDYWNFVSKEQ